MQREEGSRTEAQGNEEAREAQARDIDAHEYREVFLVVERRDGAIYKTKRTNRFCHHTRPKKENEVYASVRINPGEVFETELLT